MRVKGRVTSWNEEKGFGFITPNNEAKQIFVHISAFVHRRKRSPINQVITYALSIDKQGRSCADKVLRSGESLLKNKPKKGRQSIFIVIAFVIIVGALTLTKMTHFLVFSFYFGVSLFTFVLYARDKSAAKKGGWRTKETTLHLFALIGGWPGAIIAQQKLRHKSKKQSFRFIFWVTVLLNMGVFVWLHTPTGNETVIKTIKLDSIISFLNTKNAL